MQQGNLLCISLKIWTMQQWLQGNKTSSQKEQSVSNTMEQVHLKKSRRLDWNGDCDSIPCELYQLLFVQLQFLINMMQ